MSFKTVLRVLGKIVAWIGIVLWVACYATQAINGNPMPDGISDLAIMSLILLKWSEW